MLELLGLRRMPSTSCLPARSSRTTARPGLVATSRVTSGRRGHVGAGGVGQRGRSGDVGAIAPAACSSASVAAGSRLRRSVGARNSWLAGDHVAAQARSRRRRTVALEVDRGVEVRAGAQRRVGGRAQVDDVAEQQRDSERDRRGADRDRGEHPGDQPSPAVSSRLFCRSARSVRKRLSALRRRSRDRTWPTRPAGG